jgi:hypothetical protein
VFRSLLPAAVAFGLTSAQDGQEWLSGFERDVHEDGERTVLMPLMIGAWKRKPGGSA